MNSKIEETKRPKPVVPMSFRLAGSLFNLVSMVNPDWAARQLSRLWFRVFKSPPSSAARAFWNQADRSVELHLADKTIQVYLYGRGPLIACLHGWGGSGSQFRHLVPKLVQAGYRVAVFDAPAHGQNPGNRTHVLEFAQCLTAIEQQIAPIDSVIAHSFGAMGTLVAEYFGLQAARMVFIAPGVDIESIFDYYVNTLKIRPQLAKRFHDAAGEMMSEVAGIDDVWRFLQTDHLMQYASDQGLLIFDHADNEVTLDQFNNVARAWPMAQRFETSGLGHFRILKDARVHDEIIAWLK